MKGNNAELSLAEKEGIFLNFLLSKGQCCHKMTASQPLRWLGNGEEKLLRYCFAT